MRKHKSLDDIKQNKNQDSQIINIFYYRIKGMKQLCIKEYDRQIFLYKITSWLLYSVSPAIGGILISKKKMTSSLFYIKWEAMALLTI